LEGLRAAVGGGSSSGSGGHNRHDRFALGGWT
jgi:hypothetical protein